MLIFDYDTTNHKWYIPSHKTIEVKNYMQNNEENNRIVSICVTNKSSYLAIMFKNEILFLNINNLCVINEIKFNSDETEGIDYKIEPILDRDDIIATSNDGHFKLFRLNNEQTLSLIDLNLNKNLKSIEIYGSILSLFDDDCKSLTLYDLSRDIKVETDLNEQLFKLDFNDSANIIDYCITKDENYLITCEDKRILSVYRIRNKKELIAKIPISDKITCLTANNEFVIIGTENNRILSFLIIDPIESEHIHRLSKLTSR